MATTDEYTAESIQVLTGLEAIRRRPGMYIGNTDDGSGIHHMFLEVLGNAIDEHLAGHAKHVHVVIDDQRITVEDDGRGIPPAAIESVFTQLHLGTGRKDRHVHLARALWGIGVAPVCALSSELEATVWRDGHEHRQRFARGEPCGPVEHRGVSTRTGTRVSFVPDFTIVKQHAWSTLMIADRCRHLAALLPGLAITIDGETYRYDDLAAFLREDRELVEPFHVRTTHEGIELDVALAWHAGPSSITSFVNCSPTPDGVHVRAMRAAAYAVIARRFARISRARIERHMVAVVHVMLVDPRFGNPTRDWLTNPEVEVAVRTVVERELERHFDEAPAALDALLLQLQPRRRVRR